MATRPIGDVIEQNIRLVGGDALTQRGFTQVPNAILKAKDVSPGAKLAYTMLLSYAWHNNLCYPGQERLAEDMGVTDRSVRNYLKELEKNKYLTVRQLGQGKTNTYDLYLTAKDLRTSGSDRKYFPV